MGATFYNIESVTMVCAFFYFWFFKTILSDNGKMRLPLVLEAIVDRASLILSPSNGSSIAAWGVFVAPNVYQHINLLKE